MSDCSYTSVSCRLFRSWTFSFSQLSFLGTTSEHAGAEPISYERLIFELSPSPACPVLAGCGRKVRRSAAVYGASTVSAAFGM